MDNLLDVIKNRSKDGKIECKEAFKIAEELGISRDEVGKVLNDNKIKIVQCQLGCF